MWLWVFSRPIQEKAWGNFWSIAKDILWSLRAEMSFIDWQLHLVIGKKVYMQCACRMVSFALVVGICIWWDIHVMKCLSSSRIPCVTWVNICHNLFSWRCMPLVSKSYKCFIKIILIHINFCSVAELYTQKTELNIFSFLLIVQNWTNTHLERLSGHWP